MKLTKLFLGALALTIGASCSDNDLSQRGDGPDIINQGETANGYIAVEIKLPTESSTRADENPVANDGVEYKDGTAAEYAVENGMILLFKGKKNEGEMKAKLYRAQKLTKPFFSSQPVDDQITSSYLAAIPVSVDRTNEDYIWALVILNNNDETTDTGNGDNTIPGENDSEDNPTTIAKIAGKEFKTNNTFKDVLLQTTTNSFRGADGKSKFFMTNAPMSTVKGGHNATGLPASGNSNIQYLTPLGDQVYDTPDEAKSKVSGCVYVERAVAKVTYKLADEAIDLKFVDEKGTELDMDEFEIKADVQYALTNTNKKSFVIRNVEFGTNEKGETLAEGGNHFSWALSTNASDGLSYARLVGSTPMPVLGAPFQNTDPDNQDNPTIHQAIYRTYWCKDPNYSEQMGDDKETDDTFSTIDKPLYCKENTFTVNNQNNGNSTLAVFKINYTITDKRAGNKAVNHLFIKDGDYSKIYISKESAANDEITRIINDQGIKDAMRASLKTGASTAEYDVRDHLEIVIERNEIKKEGSDETEKTPTLLVKSISLKVPVGGDDWFNEESKTTFLNAIGAADDKDKYQYKLLEAVNALNDITEFTDAVSYHVIPIMHFGDFYTPWNTEKDAGTAGSIKGTSTKEVYNGNNDWKNDDDHAKKYLGRYGVVRNNWYELNITDIKALGSPTLPEITDNLANDNNEQKKYFAVEIHILSWAKRTQGVKF